MKCIRFELHGLYNEEWATYENFLMKAIGQIGAPKLSLIPMLSMLEANATAAADAMEIIRKSEFTRRCDEVDKKRDHIITGINSFVRSFLYDDDPALRDAAADLMIVIDHYAGMAAENRDQESNSIISFLTELKKKYSVQAGKLAGLDRRITALAAVNADYILLQDQRTFAEAGKTAVRMVDVRREGDKVIRAVWDLTDILLFTAATPEVEQFAAQLNVENQNQRTKLAARKGRREADKQTEQTPTTP